MKPRALRKKTQEKAREARERKTELERRLESLVRKGYELYLDQGFPTPTPAATPVPDPSDRAAFAAWYERSVADDIEVGYQLSPDHAERLRTLVATGELGAFTIDDAGSALELLDAVLARSLWIEHETGGGPDAVARLAEEFPGLSSELLTRMMSTMEYYNR